MKKFEVTTFEVKAQIEKTVENGKKTTYNIWVRNDGMDGYAGRIRATEAREMEHIFEELNKQI